MGCCKFSKKCSIVIGVFATIMLLISIALLGIIGAFDALVQSKIHSSIALSPSSQVYTNWVSPETPVFFSIYLFNITNKEEILRGEKPRVQEIGPYVYREKREKTNITWPKGDYSQVSFYQRITFTFDRELSVGNPDVDKITGISTPFAALSANMKAGNGPSSGEYSLLTLFVTPKLFVSQTVTEYLWGYVDELTYVCNTMTPSKCPSNKVGVMFGKNGTDAGPFVVDTGVSDITKVGNILSYQGKSVVDSWRTEAANEIKGTDGSHAAPNLDLNSTRFIFAHDLCRSFELRVLGPGKLTNSDKLKVLSMGGTKETGQSAAENPANEAYCPLKTPGPTCPPAGLFDLSSCKRQGDTRPPVYSSQPYFYQADPSLRQSVQGLPTPTAETSSTKVLIEPKLGLVLEAYKRLQISVYIDQHPSLVDEFKNWTQPLFLPIVWFEEKAIADSASLEMLYDNVYVKPVQGYNLLLVLFGIFLAVALLFLILFLVAIYSLRRQALVVHKSAASASDGPGKNSFGVKYSKVTSDPPADEQQQNTIEKA